MTSSSMGRIIIVVNHEKKKSADPPTPPNTIAQKIERKKTPKKGNEITPTIM